MSDVSEAIRQFENSPGWWDEAAWERVKEENARLREQRDKAEATLEMVKALADGYDWLSDGRGPYAYDDGRYDDDVRQFVGQLLELLPSGNWLGMREWEAKYRSTEAENAWLRERAEALKAAILDIDAHSTAMGEDGNGFITGGYIVTVGSLHRALGAVGHTARKCSHEARCPTCAQAEALATALESVRDVVVDADGRFLAAQKDVDSILQAMTEGDVHQIWKVADAALRAYREPWATVHAKYLDDQLVERCITCLERWPCKEDNHDDRH